eukprot:TRINITY_DN9687_c1_g1_i2.p1 TRINITY_DN9687_c1_g1~~TRINITY_DN9687_c1_g1_i2.p1  ORF type:complete len:752 (-),score=268.00 TRINITY_DN9687_c1_g1_i2:230-2485(-)
MLGRSRSRSLAESDNNGGDEESRDWSIAPVLKVDLAKVKVRRVRAIYDFHPKEDWQLTFNKGEIITIIDQHPGEPAHSTPSAWWEGQIGRVAGIFPVNYTEPIQLVQSRLLRIDTHRVSNSIRRLQTSAFGLRAVLLDGSDKAKDKPAEEPAAGTEAARIAEAKSRANGLAASQERSSLAPTIGVTASDGESPVLLKPPTLSDAPASPRRSAFTFAELARSALKNHKLEVASAAAVKYDELKRRIEAETERRHRAEDRLRQIEMQPDESRALREQVAHLTAENARLKSLLDPKEALLQQRFAEIAALNEQVAKYKHRAASERAERKQVQAKLKEELAALKLSRDELELQHTAMTEVIKELEDKYHAEKVKRREEKDKRQDLKGQHKDLRATIKDLELRLAEAKAVASGARADREEQAAAPASASDAPASPRPALAASGSSKSTRTLSPDSSLSKSPRTLTADYSGRSSHSLKSSSSSSIKKKPSVIGMLLSPRRKEADAATAELIEKLKEEVAQMQADAAKDEHKRSKLRKERDTLREVVVNLKEQIRRLEEADALAALQAKASADTLASERGSNAALRDELDQMKDRLQDAERSYAKLQGEAVQLGDSMLAQEDTIATLSNTIEELEDLIDVPEGTPLYASDSLVAQQQQQQQQQTRARAVSAPSPPPASEPTAEPVEAPAVVSTEPPPLPELPPQVREKYSRWHMAMRRIRAAEAFMRRPTSAQMDSPRVTLAASDASAETRTDGAVNA